MVERYSDTVEVKGSNPLSSAKLFIIKRKVVIIMNELKRRENESLLQHAKRLVESKFINRQDYDYVEIYSSIFGIEISTTEARKRLSGLRDLFEQLDG